MWPHAGRINSSKHVWPRSCPLPTVPSKHRPTNHKYSTRPSGETSAWGCCRGTCCTQVMAVLGSSTSLAGSRPGMLNKHSHREKKAARNK